MHKYKLHLFILFNLLLSTFYFDSWSNGNTTSRVLPVVSYLEKGTFYFDNIDTNSHDKSIINGHHYTDKAPLPTLLMIPIAYGLKKLGLVNTDEPRSPSLLAWSGFFFGTLPFLCILGLLYQRNKNHKRDLLYLFIPLYGSFIFAYSASMYSHVFSGFLLVLAFLALEKEKHFTVGLLLGALFITEYPLALIGVVWGLQVLYKNGLKSALLLSLGVLPSLFIIAYYNYSICGNPFTLLYMYVDPNYAFMHDDYGLGWPSISVALQLLFGQYKGLLVYCPVFALILYYGFKSWMKKKNQLPLSLLHPVILPFIVLTLLISSYAMWWGGWAFGPRHLLAPTVLLLFYSLPRLSEIPIPKIIGYGVLGCGLFIGLMSKTTYIYSVPTEEAYPLQYLGQAFFFQENFNPNNVITQVFGISPRSAGFLFCFYFLAIATLLLFFERKQVLQSTSTTSP